VEEVISLGWPRHLSILKVGSVAVIESASEAAHYPHLGHKTLASLDIPWLNLAYFDETNATQLLDSPIERQRGAIMITPGAMALGSIREAIQEYGEHLRVAIQGGMGLIMSATSLPGVDRFDLSFLPEGSQVSLVATRMRALAGTVYFERIPERQLKDTGEQNNRTGVQIAAAEAVGWRPVATLESPESGPEVLAWRGHVGRGRVTVSMLSFHWLGWIDVLEAALARASRGRGTLILGDGPGAPWYEYVDEGEFLARLTDPLSDPLETASIAENFAHLRLVGEAGWAALPSLQRESLHKRLEQSGSVEFPVNLFPETLYCRLEEKPAYLRTLDVGSNALTHVLPELQNSPTFHVLAYAALCRVARETVSDPYQLPYAFTATVSQSVLTMTSARRVRDANVDSLLIPTANLVAARALVGLEDSDDMITWISNSAAEATDDQRSQARWAARISDCDRLLAAVPPPSGQPNSVLAHISASLDAGVWPPPALMAAVTPTDLITALIHFAGVRFFGELVPEVDWDLLHAERISNVEATCYLIAAVVLTEARLPLRTGVSQDDLRSAITVVQPDLESQAALEIARLEGDKLRAVLDSVTRAGRLLFGALGFVVLLLGFVVVALPFWLRALRGVDLGVRLTMSAAIFGVVAVGFTSLVTLNGYAVVAPKWIRHMASAISRIRGK
jgi:hypothetical protein